CAQPPEGLHVSSVQNTPSSQLGGVPAPHVPPRHVSTPLHASPSSQGVPSGSGSCRHPVSRSQRSAVQTSASSQPSQVVARATRQSQRQQPGAASSRFRLHSSPPRHSPPGQSAATQHGAPSFAPPVQVATPASHSSPPRQV